MDPEPQRQAGGGEDTAPPDAGEEAARLPNSPTLAEILGAVERGEIPDRLGDTEEEVIVRLHRLQLEAGVIEPHGDYESPSRTPMGPVPRWWMEQVHPSETGEPYTDEELERGYDAGFLERPDLKP